MTQSAIATTTETDDDAVRQVVADRVAASAAGDAERFCAPPESPQPFTVWYRSTLALSRTDGAWLVIHEHTSTPFHMDGSMRAATDLQPC